MKKTLIAIAAIAATSAFAQSTVTIDGIFDSGFVQKDAKGVKTSGINQNMTDTSQINFRGKTDLGGGLAADFRFNSQWNVVSNAANTSGSVSVADPTTVTGTNKFGNGEIYLGLRGGFGYVQMGALNGLGLTHTLTSQPFGTALGSGYATTLAGSGLDRTSLRFDNAFSYTSPALVDGLTARVLMRKQQLSTTSLNGNQAAVLQLGLNYSSGPLNVSVSRLTDDATNISATFAPSSLQQKATTNNIAANYALNTAITLYAGYQGITTSTRTGAAATETRYMNFGAKYVTGVHTISGNYGRYNWLKDGGNAVNTNNAASIFGVGYEYALSKTVAATARFESIKDEIGAKGANGETGISTTAIGLRMSF